MLKDLLGDTLHGMFVSEMDENEKVMYSMYDYKNKDTDVSWNGYSPKTVTPSVGPIDLDIPRYCKGNANKGYICSSPGRYDIYASAEKISHMTDRILPLAGE